MFNAAIITCMYRNTDLFQWTYAVEVFLFLFLLRFKRDIPRNIIKTLLNRREYEIF